MTNFLQTIHEFKGENFRQTLKRQIKSLAPSSLPLEKGLTQGGYVDDPIPVNGYCEMQMIIDKQSGEAGFEVID